MYNIYIYIYIYIYTYIRAHLPRLLDFVQKGLRAGAGVGRCEQIDELGVLHL